MKRTTILLLVLILSLGTLSARQNSVAVGAQFGFTTTGVLVDVGLGDLYLQAGVNYPLGLTYIASTTDSADKFFDIYTFNADISQAFALSENFDMKIGLGTTAFTNFGPVVLGLAGAVVKGEYWIPNKNTGVFVNLNIPIMAYGFIEDDDTFDGGVVFDPLFPLAGLFTSTVGVLYAF
ncbi:hypothetical protein [Sphaerochaeta sp. S2]|uniref:hypothetical protein n=1 Tax=Sphaerochaeta sp. S2 TaxID=2798868 RepID=UPI0018E90BA7|nr:hypothetical protein [Sphaerochaeta sp. S2]MBJ2356698.1 hypothetical protein [Sphaerochaeta sp. S2]